VISDEDIMMYDDRASALSARALFRGAKNKKACHTSRFRARL